MQTQSASQPAKIGHFRTSWELTKSAWRTFKLDKELAWLQLFGSVSAIIVTAVLMVAGIVIANALFGDGRFDQPSDSWVQTATAIIGLLIVSFAVLFVVNIFSGAIIYGAVERFKGGNPTVKSSLRGALSRWQPLALFSLMMATVGVILQLLEEKLPFFGVLAVRLVGAAWNIANFFAVPVIVISEQRVTPLGATKESINIIKKVWGEGVIIQLGVGLIGGLSVFAYVLLTGAIVALASSAGAAPLTIGLGAIAVLGFLALVLLFATFGAIVKAALYYYATTGSSPDIFNKDLLDRAVRRKKATTA